MSSTPLHLRYGLHGLDVSVPTDRLSAVLRLRPVESLADPDAAVEEALRSPLASAPLETLARGRRDAVIVLCDVTRPVPNATLLRPMLDALRRAGLPNEAITLLIATGLHRPNEGEELAELIGEKFAREVRVLNHAGRDDASHVSLGATRSGVPIHLMRAFVEADLKILTGLIEPHLMAGYSGGRKLVCPGLASWRTIRELHSPRFLEQPSCRAGVLEGNPLHAELVEIARMAGLDFIVNVTLDSERRVTGVFAGDLEAAHLAGVAHARRSANVPLAAPADVVLTTGAGYPLDTTFYQTIKGMVGAIPAVKPGGAMIVAASLSEGVGGPEFTRRLFRHTSLDDLMREMLASGEVEIDQWQIEEMALAARRAELFVYSDGLDADTLRRCHVTPITRVEEGVERALAARGLDARLVVIPDGPYVTPILNGA